MVAMSELRKYLESYGWDYQQSGENTLITRFVGDNSDTQFNLVIDSGEHWVGLTVWPYLIAFPVDRKCELTEMVCRLNYDIKMARLAQTDSGGIALCVDLPTHSLNKDMFFLALDIISYYADSLYPSLVQCWTTEQFG